MDYRYGVKVQLSKFEWTFISLPFVYFKVHFILKELVRKSIAEAEVTLILFVS